MKKFIAIAFLTAFVGAYSVPTFAAVSGSEVLLVENGGDDKKKKKKEKSDCAPKECNKVSVESKSGGCCQKAPAKKVEDKEKK